MSAPDLAAMNRQMTERLLAESGAPLPDEGYALRMAVFALSVEPAAG